jgi:hypothetical protein
MTGLIGVIWGFTGVVGLIGYAIIQLSHVAIDAFAHTWLGHHWLALAGIVVFMAYSEGYRGFQQAFSPRTVARTLYLYEHPTALRVLLAPLFCMGYFHIIKRRQIVIIGLTVFIIVLIILVRLLHQPWRGIVDAGVVVGLTWGLVSLLLFAGKALLSSESFPYSPDVPQEASSPSAPSSNPSI